MLIAGIEAQLVGTFRTPSPQTQAGQGPTAAQEALAALTYITLLMALSTTMSSLVLTQEIAAIPVRAAREKDSNPQEYGGTSIQLLTRFNGGQTRWTKVMGHRMCLSKLDLWRY